LIFFQIRPSLTTSKEGLKTLVKDNEDLTTDLVGQFAKANSRTSTFPLFGLIIL
jgi:hypothetical protein